MRVQKLGLSKTVEYFNLKYGRLVWILAKKVDFLKVKSTFLIESLNYGLEDER